MSASIGFVSENQDVISVVLMTVIILLLLWNVYLQLELGKLKGQTKVLFAGKSASTLEEVIMGQIEKTQGLEQSIIALKDMDQRIISNLAYAIQKFGMVRFNPFGEVGGNQSFAIALLDNYKSGVIILSLYSRDGVRIYAKPVTAGKSEYQLSKEEAEALRIAMEK
jgi:hypothetical protein